MKKQKINIKKVVYVILVILLGKMLAFIAFELLSLKLVRSLEERGFAVIYNHILGPIYSPLPAGIYWVFIIIGAVGGFFLGLSWWRIVYVEHRHWSNWCKCNRKTKAQK